MNRVGFDTINEGLRTSHYSDVYCAKECRADVTEQIGSQTISMPIALLRIPDPNSTHNICVLGIHAPPPLPVDATGMIPYIDHLDRYIAHGLIAEDWLVCHRGDVVLLMGDLNAVPGSFPYERLINMGLRDVRSWSGIWGATWPMEYFYLPIPIFRLDQILVGGGLELKGWEAVTISNSDHRGIRVWF
jgi:hypothetical protein